MWISTCSPKRSRLFPPRLSLLQLKIPGQNTSKLKTLTDGNKNVDCLGAPRLQEQHSGGPLSVVLIASHVSGQSAAEDSNPQSPTGKDRTNQPKPQSKTKILKVNPVPEGPHKTENQFWKYVPYSSRLTEAALGADLASCPSPPKQEAARCTPGQVASTGTNRELSFHPRPGRRRYCSNFPASR